MTFELLRRTTDARGLLVEVEARGLRVRLSFLWHAVSRMRRWQVPEERVIETLLFPEEVIVGHHGRFIAQRRYGTHLVRAVYSYDDELPVVVTVYYPFWQRYFQGGTSHADKILP